MKDIRNADFHERIEYVVKQIRSVANAHLVRLASSVTFSGLGIYLALTVHLGWWIFVAYMVYRSFNALNFYNTYSRYANKVKSVLDIAIDIHNMDNIDDSVKERLDTLPYQAINRMDNGLSIDESLDRFYNDMLELKKDATRAS